MGFSIKHDSGDVRGWGNISNIRLTQWIVLGGPVIGFRYRGPYKDFSLIVGNMCRPKYFGARKLSLRPGKNREVEFYWQKSYPEYFSNCLSKGLCYVFNYE